VFCEKRLQVTENKRRGLRKQRKEAAIARKQMTWEELEVIEPGERSAKAGAAKRLAGDKHEER
jgi:hypothetical protein